MNGQYCAPRRPDVGHHDGLGVATERVLEKASQLGIAIRNVRRFRVHLEKRSRMLYSSCYSIPILPIDGRGRITCYHARKRFFVPTVPVFFLVPTTLKPEGEKRQLDIVGIEPRSPCTTSTRSIHYTLGQQMLELRWQSW